MKYIMRIVDTSQEGDVTCVSHWVADSETAMSAILKACETKCSNREATCLGPVQQPNDYMQEKIDECRKLLEHYEGDAKEEGGAK